VRAVADTNTVVSAFLWGGVPADILTAAREQRRSLFTSAALIAERAAARLSCVHIKQLRV